MFFLRLSFRALLGVRGLYPSFAAVAKTSSLVSAEMLGLLLKTLDTVAGETLASLATSFTVTFTTITLSGMHPPVNSYNADVEISFLLVQFTEYQIRLVRPTSS
jgi:hypothetical protein